MEQNVITNTTISKETLQAQVDQYYWHHSIDFGNGVVSKGNGSLEHIHVQSNAMFNGLNLKGKSLLDIGAWNGAFSFEAKRRGCARVVASDKYCWTKEFFKGRETFDLAVKLTGLDVEAWEIDVPDINPEALGMFDVVLFAGVFYHLISPINLTRQISECARHVLILETHQDFLHSAKPGMMFYPEMSLNGDPTNWWGPNPRLIYELLKEFGFVRVFYQDAPGYNDPSLPNFRKRGIFHAFRSNESLYEMGGKYDKWMDLVDEDVRADLFRPAVQDAKPPHPMPEALGAQLEAERAANHQLSEENRHLSEEVHALRQSTSWKVTAPLRAMSRALAKRNA